MIVHVEQEKLKKFLSSCEEAEMVGENEYAVDLYDCEPPLSVNLEFGEEGVDVLAALFLLYDEEQDGWYLGEKTKDTHLIEDVLHQVIGG